MKVRTVAILLAALATSLPRSTAAQTALSAAEVQSAIDWGVSHDDVGPYLLRHAERDGTNDVVVGAVYTPFIRIALMSRRAWMEGRRVTPDDLPSQLTDSRVAIAARWYPVIAGCTLDDETNVMAVPKGATVMSIRAGHGGSNAAGGIRPSAVRPPSWLRTLGIEPPYRDIAAVAFFPLDILRKDLDLLVWRDGTTDAGLPCVSVETGRIPLTVIDHLERSDPD